MEVKTGSPFRAGKPTQLLEGSYGLRVGSGEDRGADYQVVPDNDVSEDEERFPMVQTVARTPVSTTQKLQLVLNWFEELRRILEKPAP